MENTEENSEKIWKIWKKGKLKCEMILKIQKQIVKRYGRNPSWIIRRYGRKASRIVIRYGQFRRKASWISKRYENMEETQVKSWKDMEER